ncbi:hypothetical protein ABZ467_17330 [Streptomyces sp. NPDC005727]|uniref:hypothetical protein n=1 Tax=Streptomyces sp. NPDC005727 TaxID=3157053 RepID=UPI0034091544
MTPNPGSAAHERLLDRWLDDLQVPAARLEQVYLDRDFAFDYTPASLAALEHALLEEEPGDGFRRAATSCIGEVLMDVCGGRWDINSGTDGEDGDPVVRPDPALGLAPLSIGTLIDVALANDPGRCSPASARSWRARCPGAARLPRAGRRAGNARPWIRSAVSRRTAG